LQKITGIRRPNQDQTSKNCVHLLIARLRPGRGRYTIEGTLDERVRRPPEAADPMLAALCENNEFGDLLKPQIPCLRRYARILTKDLSRAEDLLQSCLVRALEKQHLWALAIRSPCTHWRIPSRTGLRPNTFIRRRKGIRISSLDGPGRCAPATQTYFFIRASLLLPCASVE
jgi:hypothetical protein